jgi:hypothetical protein
MQVGEDLFQYKESCSWSPRAAVFCPDTFRLRVLSPCSLRDLVDMISKERNE